MNSIQADFNTINIEEIDSQSSGMPDFSDILSEIPETTDFPDEYNTNEHNDTCDNEPINETTNETVEPQLTHEENIPSTSVNVEPPEELKESIESETTTGDMSDPSIVASVLMDAKKTLEKMESEDDADISKLEVKSGFMVDYRISGSSFGTRTESIDDYQSMVRNVIPKSKRSLFGSLRGAIEGELDECSIKMFNGLRYVPADKLSNVQEILKRAKKGGVGTRKRSIDSIIESMWESKDTINEKASDLGLDFRLDSKEKLTKDIHLKPFITELATSGSSNNTDEVSEVRQEAIKTVASDIKSDLKSRLEETLTKLSDGITKIEENKYTRINQKSANKIRRQTAQISDLNIMDDPDVDNLVNAINAVVDEYSQKTGTKKISTKAQEMMASALNENSEMSDEDKKRLDDEIENNPIGAAMGILGSSF